MAARLAEHNSQGQHGRDCVSRAVPPAFVDDDAQLSLGKLRVGILFAKLVVEVLKFLYPQAVAQTCFNYFFSEVLIARQPKCGSESNTEMFTQAVNPGLEIREVDGCNKMWPSKSSTRRHSSLLEVSTQQTTFRAFTSSASAHGRIGCRAGKNISSFECVP
jgi:hypothetical protein